MRDFRDDVVFVTGGTRGMGLATAVALARRGAHIAIFSSSAQGSDAAIRQIEGARLDARQRVTWNRIDVGERHEVLERFAQATAELGPPDVVINMAGLGGVAPFAAMPLEMFERIMRINVGGTRHVAEAALLSMQARGRGTIVLVGSLGGFVPVYGYTAYGTSKFAVVGFAQCLRYELQPLGIDVACFCPGEVDTPGLAGESEHTHPATVAMKKLGGTMPIDAAVRALIAGISANRFLIIPGLRSKILYWAARTTPMVMWNAIADRIVARGLRKG